MMRRWPTEPRAHLGYIYNNLARHMRAYILSPATPLTEQQTLLSPRHADLPLLCNHMPNEWLVPQSLRQRRNRRRVIGHAECVSKTAADANLGARWLTRITEGAPRCYRVRLGR